MELPHTHGPAAPLPPPPPPPPPPLPPGARRHIDSANTPMQLPPHLQAMMQQHVAGQDLRSELPMQFGAQPRRKHPQHQQQQGRGGGGGRGMEGGNGGGRGGRGGNARGRGGGGRGRGGSSRGGNHYGSSYNNSQQNQFQPQGNNNYNNRGGGRGGNAQFKRKRGLSDDVKDPSRFFLPSCLEDPWKHLEARLMGLHVAAGATQQQQQQPEHHQNHQQQQPNSHGNPHQHQRNNAQRHVDRPGRVLFQPSFLADPWQKMLRA